MKALLMILDGWGISPDPSISAVDQAYTPFIDSLYKNNPHATLRTDGMDVGLPNGQMGNSEVGHVNLGAGRVVYQDLAKINIAVDNDTLKDEPVLQEAFKTAKENKVKLHFLGLVSDGGVHAHVNHIKGLVRAAKLAEVPDVYVHAFTDGRDVDPKSGAGFIEELQESCAANNAQIASVVGRYYAMDRDKRWERVKKAYDLLVHGKGKSTTNFVEAIQNSYANGTTDEFIEPLVSVGTNNQPLATIRAGDVVVFFNFRTDRGRQLTQALYQQNFEDYEMKKQDLHFVTLTNYGDFFRGFMSFLTRTMYPIPLEKFLPKQEKSKFELLKQKSIPTLHFSLTAGVRNHLKAKSAFYAPRPKLQPMTYSQR